MTMYVWENAEEAKDISYVCGYCDAKVAPSRQFTTDSRYSAVPGAIYICPNCSQPTFYDYVSRQTPQPLLGRDVSNIENVEIGVLYGESRACTSLGAHTAAVMVCRKILMNLAVSVGAKENEGFVYYVNYLFENGYVPPKGKAWVDAIRKRGNTANHEIRLMNEKDASLMLHFVEGLLRFNYELPNMLEEDSKA